MKFVTLKQIGKILLFGSVLFFLNTKDSICPTPNIILIESAKPIIRYSKKVIILDPGHGMGNRIPGLMDWGKTYLDYREAEIVLEKAKEIRNMLDKRKYDVFLTREDNTTPCPIESRPKLANEKNADLFLSIHVNNFKNLSNINGSEIYWRYKKDKELAKLAAKNLYEVAFIHNRYVVQEEYLMLKDVKCPAALLEVGYLLNKEDRGKILNEKGVEKAIAKTIEDYLK
jgi:N-acetylmuramoyl-L-alanine amidase